MYSPEARAFYQKALILLREHEISFMVGGAWALAYYTGIRRDTKDLDLFCIAEDYPAILQAFNEKGYYTEITDSRWLAKVYQGDYFADIIFNTPNNMCPIDESWYTHAVDAKLLEQPVLFIAPEELIWCKTYLQSRYRFDGADIHHLFLKQGKYLDWDRLLKRLNLHWLLLLAHLITFQFVYPADFREIVPQWVFDHLFERVRTLHALPKPLRKICLGPLIDQRQYDIDIKEWGYEVINI